MSNYDRKNEILESYKAYKESKTLRESKYEEIKKTTANKKATFLKEYYKIREKRELSEREHGKLLEEAKNYFFGNVLKGIYIAALESETLTDDALYLAENMVDSYIKENGGYQAIMGNAKVDTYLLAKIRRVVEDAAEEEVKQIEDTNKEIEDVEDIELQDSPEDEKDTTVVSGETKLTTANINDIVNALNQAGLEVVKKGEDADNFKESQPETPETKPDMEIEDNQEEEITTATPEDEPAETTTTEPEETTTATPESEEDTKEEDVDMDEFDKDMEAAENSKEESEESTEDKAEEESPTEEDDELDKDLEVADKNNEEKEEDFDDTIDPDAVKVQDSEESDDDEDIEIDDSEEEGEEDSDDEDYDEEESGDDEDYEDEEESDEEDDGDAIDIDGDGDPDVGDIEEPEETVNVDPNKTMMDELENEKEIKDAVELIRTRVADAEEAFIKRNQEDKQKIDDLLSKISKNVATVEKISSEEGEGSKEAESAKKTMEESTLMYKKQIINIRENKPMSIFEKMTRDISESIIKDPRKVNMFINESTGTPDFGLITETSKVMYGFLETLNTLQLESVNSKYILNIINNIR